jgi:hypothetical protein
MGHDEDTEQFIAELINGPKTSWNYRRAVFSADLRSQVVLICKDSNAAWIAIS